MNYSVYTIPPFDKQLKRLVKKYPSLKEEFSEILDELTMLPETGTHIGNSVYKIRISISSKGKGKSGGARIITYVQIQQSSVYLLTIYDKSEKEDVSKEELNKMIQNIID